MSKNYLIILGVAGVLLLGGVAFAFKHQVKTLLMPQGQGEQVKQVEQVGQVNQGEQVPQENKMEAVVVTYDPKGFSPTTLTVKKGTAVKFVNKSGSTMSVASNPHPTHTDYPGFDQFKSDARGKDEYSFTFTKVGSWGFHNHAKPSDGGTVVVTE